jgi:hypothetical protein
MNNICIAACNDENVENLLLSDSTMGRIRRLLDEHGSKVVRWTQKQTKSHTEVCDSVNVKNLLDGLEVQLGLYFEHHGLH